MIRNEIRKVRGRHYTLEWGEIEGKERWGEREGIRGRKLNLFVGLKSTWY